jgi:Putative MetA-pathway of phenol degradation
MSSFFRKSVTLPALVLSVALVTGTERLAAQTDYYNTDAGRPIQIEDAYATERYAFEMKLASVRLERLRGGVYNWAVEPELAYGILPRTHIEVELPLAYTDFGGNRSRSGVAGLDLSLFHNLNVETRTLPALALRADVLFPVGPLGPARTYASIKGIATRTYSSARFHVNGQYTFGSRGEIQPTQSGAVTASGGVGAIEVSKWLAGIAVDKTFPLRAMLITVDVFARQPIIEEDEVDYNIGTGIRYQVSPKWAIDGGAGRRLNGPGQGWFATFGTAYTFGLHSLLPRSGR